MVRVPTQSDVAREAGVSRQLVSLVVRNDPKVSQKRREAVLAAMDKLGYRPNAAAQSLAQKSSKTIGLIVPSFQNPFYGEFAQAFTSVVHESGWRTLLAVSLEDKEMERTNIEQFLQMRTDGLALVSPYISHGVLRRIAQETPVCLVSNVSAPSNCDLVHTHDFDATRQLTKHLADQGYERVIYLGYQSHREGDTRKERALGYRQAMKEIGQADQTSVVYIEGSVSQAAHDVIKEYGVGAAIVAHNDLVAVELMMAIHNAGLRPGIDIGVTGFDNTRLSAMPEIDLTTIDQQLEVMAQATMDCLLRRIADPQLPQSDIAVPPCLVERKSSQLVA